MLMRASFIALSLAALGGQALADSAPTGQVRYTDAAPYSDLQPQRSASGTPQLWKGDLSRSEVLGALQAARSETLAVGDAIDYPLRVGHMPTTSMLIRSRGADPTVMGGPPTSNTTIDGYRFVGGEAGYVKVR
jgi:hypothetical protein